MEEMKDRFPDRAELRNIRALMRELARERALLRRSDGDTAERYRALISENCERAAAECERLQRKINEIPDSETRQIFTMHYIRGYSWLKTAFALGYYCESTPRMRAERYMKGQ